MNTLFEKTKDTPSEWQAALELIVPRTDRTSWLKIAWMAGKDYEPVQRWVIYEMRAESGLSEVERDGSMLVLDGLKGPRPDTHGHWIPANVPGNRRWVSHSTVSQLQWDLYRETKCIPRLFWIIQGSSGGHRWVLSEIEQRFIRAMRGDQDDTRIQMPAPGDLPYAPYDRRVEAHILRYDRLRNWEQTMSTPWESRTMSRTAAGLYVSREDAAVEENYAREMQAFLAEQIDGAISDLTRTEASRLVAQAIPASDDFMANADDISEAMITDAITSTRGE